MGYFKDQRKKLRVQKQKTENERVARTTIASAKATQPEKQEIHKTRDRAMNPNQLGPFEQLLRMGMMAGGNAALGEGIASGDEYQAAVGGVIAIVSFVWWYIRQRQVTAK